MAAVPAEAAHPNRIGNPVMPGWYADPSVRVFDGKYYIYPTNSTSSYNSQYHAYSSDDMVHWKDEGVIFDFASISWCDTQAWAPDVIEKDGTYYLYFSACDGKIGVATAASPTGPFSDAIGGPLLSDPRIWPCYADIDPAVFIDTDDQAYLYYGTEYLCVRKLNPDMKSFADPEPTQLVPYRTGYQEGSYMIKRNGTYYLSWSTGGWTDCTYNVHYGRSDSPYGPFEDEGVIITTDGIQTPLGCGPGHHSLFKAGADDWYIGYHKHPVGYVQGEQRYMAIDKLNFNPDGTIKPVTMTNGALEGKLTNGQYSLTGWWKFDELDGASAADASPVPHPGSINGSGSWKNGKEDGAYNFKGGAFASASTAVHTNESFSVSAWVKLNTLKGNQTFVSQDGKHVSGFSLQYSQSADNKFAFGMPGADDSSASANRVYSNTIAKTGEWTHLLGVYDKTLHQLRLYINGKLEGIQTAGAGWEAAGATIIGAGQYSDARTDFANAVIDEVRTFAYPLSDGIAKQEYLDSPNLNLYWNFDEDSGNANDESGSTELNFGDYGILNGGVTRSAGIIGNGISLNGIDGFVSSSSSNLDKRYSLIDSATDFTVSAWVKLNSLSGRQTVASVDGSNVSGFNLQFGDETGKRFAFSVTDSDEIASAVTRAVSTTVPLLNTWYHLVGVHDRSNGQLRLYVNGNLQGTAEISTGWVAAGNVVVGAAKRGGRTDYFNGTIDEVGLYNRVLSNEEIIRLASGPDTSASSKASLFSLDGDGRFAQIGIIAALFIAFVCMGLLLYQRYRSIKHRRSR
nr:LamG-like jellyroll fold domain-containing protein [Cohnella candidum]